MSIEKCIRMAYWLQSVFSSFHLPIEWVEDKEGWENLLEDWRSLRNSYDDYLGRNREFTGFGDGI